MPLIILQLHRLHACLHACALGFQVRFPIGSFIIGMATSRNSISAFFRYVKAVRPLYTQPLDGLCPPCTGSLLDVPVFNVLGASVTAVGGLMSGR